MTLAKAIEPQLEPVALDRRHDPEVRRQMSAPALRTFFNIAAAWDLSVNTQRAMLGWPAASTYHKYKSGQAGTLSYDTLVRISLIIGIYKALHILYPEATLANRWINLPNNNSMFGGNTPAAFIAEGGIDALYQMRRLLDGRQCTSRSSLRVSLDW